MTDIEWKCSGCGEPYPNRVGYCDCTTSCLFLWDGERMLHEIKRLDPKRCAHNDIMKKGNEGATTLKIECADCGTMFQCSTPDVFAELQTAVRHIEHMAAWIGKQNAGYSFEALSEEMPGIRAAIIAGKGREP